jgi:hypothetical protein
LKLLSLGLTSTLTISDFQSTSFAVQKGNLGEELTGIVFRSISGVLSSPGQSITQTQKVVKALITRLQQGCGQ